MRCCINSICDESFNCTATTLQVGSFEAAPGAALGRILSQVTIGTTIEGCKPYLRLSLMPITFRV